MEIHYFAAARAARGVEREMIADTPDTLGQLVDRLGEENTGATEAGMALSDVFERCSFLVDGARSDRSASLAGAARVDVLPPFAGG